MIFFALYMHIWFIQIFNNYLFFFRGYISKIVFTSVQQDNKQKSVLLDDLHCVFFLNFLNPSLVLNVVHLHYMCKFCWHLTQNCSPSLNLCIFNLFLFKNFKNNWFSTILLMLALICVLLEIDAKNRAIHKT